MNFFKRLLGWTAKAGETVAEVGIVIAHVDALEKIIQGFAKDPFASAVKVTEMLSHIEAIKSGINDIRH